MAHPTTSLFNANCPPPFWSGGPNPSNYYQFPGEFQQTSGVSAAPHRRSQYPITTGSSVIAIKFKHGVVIASDTMGSYGSMARYPQLQRVVKVNDGAAVAFSGDVADFQFLNAVIERKQISEDIRGGGVGQTPAALHCWLTRYLYNRRSKLDPLWNTLVIGGMEGDEPFLGCVDMIGTAWTEDIVATGIGLNLAIPSMTDMMEKEGLTGPLDISEEQAKELIRKVIRICYLRDCRATSKYHVATITKEKGVEIEGPINIDSNWEFARCIAGFD